MSVFFFFSLSNRKYNNLLKDERFGSNGSKRRAIFQSFRDDESSPFFLSLSKKTEDFVLSLLTSLFP